MKGHPIDALASQVDLLPTLLDLVGATLPAGLDGASLLPLLEGTQSSVRSTTLVEGGVSWHNDGIARGAVIAPPWALLRQDRGCTGGREMARKPGEPATCLYDLLRDPGQEQSVALDHPEVVTELLSRWDKFRAARGNVGETLSLDPAYVKQLQQTGYDFRPGSP
jgi:arylsulfatase A-like enzyme